MPGMLMKFGCAAGNAPRPISVVTAGASSISTNSRNSGSSAGGNDAAARVDQRPLRFPHHLRGAPDLSGVAFGENFVARQMNGSHRRVMRLGLEHIFGNIHQHRAGTAAGGNIESLMNGLRQILRRVFTRKLCLVQERVMPNVSASWNASLPISLVETWPVMATIGMESIMESTSAGDQIGCAGAGGGAADAHLARGARLAFRREASVLLMPDEDMPDGMIVHGVIERKRDAAGIAEDAFDVLAHQTLQQNLRARHQFRFRSRDQEFLQRKTGLLKICSLKMQKATSGFWLPAGGLQILFPKSVQAAPGTAT